jgi:tRNA (cmo5U34)-methyltransferase
MSQSNVDPSTYFNESAAVSNYVDRTRRLVPGWFDLQRMAALLVAERAPEQANVLVVGAGGGAELTTFARMYSQWRFVGVDPSASMLELAEASLGPLIERVQLHHGYVATAPAGPFDAATCLLTMHFVPADERRRTLQEIRNRLKPGAPFVMAHLSFPQAAEEKKRWLSRYAAFAVSSGVEPESAHNAASVIESNLPLLAPADEEAMLAEAGFTDIQTFYAGFVFRGWVAFTPRPHPAASRSP